MKRIYKYDLNRHLDRQTVRMPLGAFIISIQAQGEDIKIWAIVDPDEAIKDDRYFWIIYTGSKIFEPKGGTKLYYRATVVVESRGMVYHVFEEAPIIQDE